MKRNFSSHRLPVTLTKQKMTMMMGIGRIERGSIVLPCCEVIINTLLREDILMGMYTTIVDEQVKFTGLFATVAASRGNKPTQGVLTISKDEVEFIMTDMAVSLSNGTQLLENGFIEGRLIACLEGDAHTLRLLIEWVLLDEEEELFFA